MRVLGALRPVAARPGLDGHQAGVLPAHLVDEGQVVGAVLLGAPQHGVERRQHGGEGVPAQRLEVRGGGVPPVAGDADRTDEALVDRPGRGLEGTVGTRRQVQLAGVAHGVQLQQVDPVGLQPLQRGVDLPPRRLAVALTGLRGQEDPVADPRDPRAEPQLGVAVARGDVEVVDAGVQRLLDRPVGDVLGHVTERRRAVDEHRALVAETSEPAGFHGPHPGAPGAGGQLAGPVLSRRSGTRAPRATTPAGTPRSTRVSRRRTAAASLRECVRR